MTPIDKDELLKALRQRYDNLKQWYKNTTNEDAKTNASFAMAECFEIGNIVKEQPTVDAVPVVRCKNCKHSQHWYGDKRLCYLWNETGIDVFEDGYCAYGERME